MARTSHITPAGSSEGNRPNFGTSRIEIRAIDAVMRAARRLYARKMSAELAARAKRSQRACEFWMSKRHGLSGDALANLLRSDDGLTYLEELMGDARPAWWRDVKRAAQVSVLRKRQDEQRLLIERLEREAAGRQP